MGRKPKWPPTVHTNSKGQHYVRIRENGKPREIYLGPAGSEKARANYDRLKADMEARPHRAPPRPSPGPALTVAGLLLRYYEHAQGYYAGSRNVRAQLERIRRAVTIATRLFGPLRAAEF